MHSWGHSAAPGVCWNYGMPGGRYPSSRGPEPVVLQLSLNQDAKIQPVLPARSSDLPSGTIVLMVNS